MFYFRHDWEHGGPENPCFGDGLMSYGLLINGDDRWTSCNNADFADWFMKSGHECLAIVEGTPPSVEPCPEGFRLFAHSGKCYKFFDEKLSWDEAEHKCNSEWGNLASVPDEETNAFLDSLAPKRGFIGGYLRSDGTWAWSDGSPWIFTKWRAGEPNNHGGEEDVIELIGSAWFDVPANHPYDRGYICQMKQIGKS